MTDAGKIGEINVTGLGLPSEMAGCVDSGATKSFAIWNPIDLGYAATMIAHNISKGTKTGPGAVVPMGRMGTGGDISSLVLFLASNEASYITGQNIHVNGGMFLG